jgi:hypothetical protein
VRGPLRLGSRKAAFLCQRAVDKGDEPQAARLRRYHLLEIGKGEAIDNCLRAVGHTGEHRRVCLCTPFGKLDDPNEPAARTQSLDNVTVEQISAGNLIEPAGDDEDKLSAKRSFIRRVRRSRSERWSLVIRAARRRPPKLLDFHAVLL